MDYSDTLIERPKMQELIDKLEEIQMGFRQNLNNLHQKLEMLDSRHDLQNSLEGLRILSSIAHMTVMAQLREQG